MVAVAEAAELAGAPDLNGASADQLAKAWGLVRKAADISLEELCADIAKQSHLSVADLTEVDAHAGIDDFIVKPIDGPLFVLRNRSVRCARTHRASSGS
jgi:hypothetical protein